MPYRPLPDCVTISHSKIEGLGLVATVDIPAKISLGISHVRDDRFENNHIRTPLGGFINHSDTPNCKIILDMENLCFILETAAEIKAGEELTLKYSLYDVKGHE